MNMEPEKAISNLFESLLKLGTYKWLVDRLGDCDVSRDMDYQRMFKGYYGVRRDDKWSSDYFSLMQELKGERMSIDSFRRLLGFFQKKYGRVEASFISKLISTVDVDMPIWDSHVIEKLGIKRRWERDKSINNACEIYARIQQEYNEYLKSDDGRRLIAEFDRLAPNFRDVSSVKKLDLVVWA